jgi:hypothetical protein
VHLSVDVVNVDEDSPLSGEVVPKVGKKPGLTGVLEDVAKALQPVEQTEPLAGSQATISEPEPTGSQESEQQPTEDAVTLPSETKKPKGKKT